MQRGQLDGWWLVLLLIFAVVVMAAYGAFEIFARQGANAWDILTMLS